MPQGFLVHGHCSFAFLSKRLIREVRFDEIVFHDYQSIRKNSILEQASTRDHPNATMLLYPRLFRHPPNPLHLSIHHSLQVIYDESGFLNYSFPRPWLHHIFTEKKYIALPIAFFLFHGVYWYLGTLLCVVDPFSLSYMNQTFIEVFNVPTERLTAVMLHFEVSSEKETMHTSHFQKSRPDLNQKAWVVLLLAAFLFSATVTGFLLFGGRAYQKLRTVLMSERVKAVHLQLLKILIIQVSSTSRVFKGDMHLSTKRPHHFQTLILVVVAMFPCSLIWLSAVFGSESPAWHNLYMVPLMSSFPFLDPSNFFCSSTSELF